MSLPSGLPIMTFIRMPRRYAHVLWEHGRMTRYTINTGIGVSFMPVRFFSKGEVAVITFRPK